MNCIKEVHLQGEEFALLFISLLLHPLPSPKMNCIKELKNTLEGGGGGGGGGVCFAVYPPLASPPPSHNIYGYFKLCYPSYRGPKPQI